MTIDAVFDAFLADQRARLSERTYANYQSVIELLGDCLNSYGPNTLSPSEHNQWETAFKNDEEAFVHLFGADKIIDNLGEFLGYYMIRKVWAGQELLKAAATVTKKLTAWLHAHGLIDDTDTKIGTERAADAARDLPAADKLGTLLHEQARHTLPCDPDDIADDDRIEDYLTIQRVDTAALWFHGGIGPVAVPATAAKLARPGWSVSITLARIKNRWRIIEVGNVYP
jgi:hypothetical protein